MELLVGLLSGLVGAAAGGLASFFTSRSQLRLDLEFAYDRELRTQRMAAYRSLYARTEKLPRYWRDPPRRRELPSWSEGLHQWYFAESGGLFLSDLARVAYHDVLEVIADIAGAGAPEDVLGPADEERLWRAGQGLRRRLAGDLGTAQAPRVTGDEPLRTGPPARRIGAVPTDGAGS